MQEDYNVGYFGDERLKKTVTYYFERMHQHKTVSLRRLAGNRATEVKFGRWLRNKKVEVSELIPPCASIRYFPAWLIFSQIKSVVLKFMHGL